MIKKKIVIAGGGLTGLSAAWHLQKRGRPFLLFEKEKEAGGLCRSKKIDGFIFDHSSHVLHFKDPYALAFVKKFLGKNLKQHKRVALFYAFGRYGQYPFQANLNAMPSRIVRECVAGAKKVLGKNDYRGIGSKNFESWIFENFGSGIARHFLIPYNTKFWTVPLATLTCEWAKMVVPVPSLDEIADGALKAGSKSWGYNTTFWYPVKGGIHQLPLRIASCLDNAVMDCAVKAIDLRKKEVVFSSGKREKFDDLITTIPLPELALLIKDIPNDIRRFFKMLKWNSILNLNFSVEGHLNQLCHWVYFPEKDIPFFRAGFPYRFSSHLVPRGQSALSLEIAYRPGHRPDQRILLGKIIKNLKKIGLVLKGQRIALLDSRDIVYGYPIYDHKCALARQEIMGFLNKHRIFSVGRYGGWRYMSMEDSILEGKAVAEKLV